MRAVLHGMEYLVGEIRRGKRVDAAVFHAMLYYIDTVSERVHHPSEDRFLFEALRRRSAGAEQLITELEKEHAIGEVSLRRLAQSLNRHEEGGEREFAAFEAEVKAFVRRYDDHMRKEEEQLFPLALKMLKDADWERIDSAFEKSREPLAGHDTRDFEKLFQRIAEIAPEPVGLGARAPTIH